MTITAKREYIALIWKSYQLLGSQKKEKGVLLDEVCRNLGVTRKSAIRLLNSPCPPTLRKSSGARRAFYSEETQMALVRLWHAMGRMGSVRMRAALPDWLPFYWEEELSMTVKAQLLSMSARTIERLLQKEKRAWRRKNNCGTRRSRTPTLVPLRPLGECVTSVGHVEVDTVAHCGDSIAGQFAWTVTATDILSGWTEIRTVWTKDASGIVQALREIEQAFPFRLKSLYVDNGCEFLNRVVVQEFALRSHSGGSLPIYRGRPYRKNDQCYVEEKNWTHVRELYGYIRVGASRVVPQMNRLAESCWLPLQNFFCPQSKLASKERVGSQLKRRHHSPKTPFERLLEQPESEVSWADKERLLQMRSQLNPFELRKKLRKRLYELFRYLDATDSMPRRYGT